MIFEIPDILIGFIGGIALTIGAVIGTIILNNARKGTVVQTIGGL